MKQIKILTILCIFATLLLGYTYFDSICKTPGYIQTTIQLEDELFIDKLKNEQELVLDRQIAVIYDNSDASYLQTITSYIQDKMKVDVYSIDDYLNINISDYDVILIGSKAIDNAPSDKILTNLPKIDFLQKEVSFYYIDAFDSTAYEEKLGSLVINGNVTTSLGFNSDEISETEIVNYFIDEWLTSIYFTPINDVAEKK